MARSISHSGATYLGVGPQGEVFAHPEHGTLVLGPPRSGKTTAIVIPNVCCANGPVVSVSTKRDVIDATYAARSQVGPCFVFDLAGLGATVTSAQRVGWSPLRAAQSWDGAVLVADAMVGASRKDAYRGESAHWNERASALLATLFHAGALGEMTMAHVVASVNRRDVELLLGELARHDAVVAIDLLMGILATDSREQSGIWSTASGVLAAYRSDIALKSAAIPSFLVEQFLSTRATLYVVASSEQQQHMAPIIAGLIREVRIAAYDRFRDGRSPSGARVLLVLDELANIAPLHDLPVLVAEGASQGIVTLACLQDLAQARSRWGVAAEGFLSLFGTKLILPGIGDVRTLDAISQLAGDHHVPSVTRTHPRHFSRRSQRSTRSVGTRKERRLPVDHIAQVPAQEAIALIGAVPARLRLTPHFATEIWSRALGS